MNAQNCLNRRQLESLSFVVTYDVAADLSGGTAVDSGKLTFDSPLYQFKPRELSCFNLLEKNLYPPINENFVLTFYPFYAARNGNLLLPNTSAAGNNYKYRDIVEIIKNKDTGNLQLLLTYYTYRLNFVSYVSDLPDANYPYFVCLVYNEEQHNYELNFITPDNYKASNGTIYARLDSISEVVSFVYSGLGSGAIFYPDAPNDSDPLNLTIPRLFATKEAFLELGWGRFGSGFEEFNHNTTNCNFYSHFKADAWVNEGVSTYEGRSQEYKLTTYTDFHVGFGFESSFIQDPIFAVNLIRPNLSSCCRGKSPIDVVIVAPSPDFPFPEGGSAIYFHFEDLKIGNNEGVLFPDQYPPASGTCSINVDAKFKQQ